MADEKSEAASETQSGGRPRLLSKNVELAYRAMFPGLENASTRTLQARKFASDAMGILMECEGWEVRFSWIFPVGNSFKKPPKWTILEALGRIADRDAIIGLADALCERRLTVKAALVCIQHYRSGETISPKASQLADKMIDVANWARSRGCDHQTIIRALTIASEMVSEAASKSE